MWGLESAWLITELFAACALLANIVAYRQQQVRGYRIYSGCAMLLLAIHFLRLEAYAAAIGCSLAVVRNVVSLKYNDWLTTGIFVVINLVGLGIEWFYLHHGPEIFIAYTASLIFTVGTLRLENLVDIRRWFTLAEGLNLVYALVVGSVFGSIYSVFNLCVLAMFWISHFRQRKMVKETS